MRRGLLAVLVLAFGVAAWRLWPDERVERRDRRDAPAKRVVPEVERPAPEPDVFDRVAKGFAELKEAERPTMRGKVTGPDGEPVGDAEVHVFDAKPVVTNSRGEFVFAWPADTEKVDLLVAHHAYLDAQARRARADGFDFVLKRGLAISGRVAFPDGSPMPRWKVEARVHGGEKSWGWTGDDGRFTLTGLERGEVQVSTRLGRGLWTVPSSAGAADVSFEMRESILRVTLRHPDGGPVHDASASVQVGRLVQRVLSGWSAVRPGSDAVLRVTAPGLRSVERTIPAWSSTPALYEQTVVFERAGNAKVLLDVRMADGTRPYMVFVKVLGTARSVVFEDEPVLLGDFEPGLVRLQVHANTQAYLDRTLELVAVEGEPEPIRVDLPAGTTVIVKWPGAGTAVRLWPYGSKLFHDLIAFENEYRLSYEVPVGRYTLTGHTGIKQVREEELVLEAKKTTRIDWSE